VDTPVAFITLFLGLAAGRQNVDVAVTPGVASLVFQLDGRVAATVERPPWRATIDFGAELLPHELEVVARRADQVEIGRIRQLVNVARAPAEIRLLIERDASARPAFVKWVGTSLGELVEPEVEMTLDGRPLAIDADRRARLPKLDTEKPHVISAQATFGPGASARHDIVIGGSIQDESEVELTAVPFTLPSSRSDPAAVRVAVRGVPATPASIERGTADVLLVRSAVLPAEALRRLAGRSRRAPSRAGPRMSERPFDAGDPNFRRYDARLEGEDRLKMLWNRPGDLVGGSLPTRLFNGSREFPGAEGGFYWLLTAVSGDASSNPPRFADAVAVAGLQAMATGRRRAVVLLLDDTARDASFYTPVQVRRYFESIRVPLFVWTVGRTTPLSGDWGGAIEITAPRALDRAVEALRKELDRQRIAWIPGVHLPTEIAVQAPPSVP
jgi:hypothetical protein